MILIETCPVCGHDLECKMLCTYPGIPRKDCRHCGWHWQGEMEQIIRVPAVVDDPRPSADDTPLEQQLSAALAQLHRYVPCKTCKHRDRSAPDYCGCLIGGCTVDGPDLWTWDGGDCIGLET